jgi:hypothetical protein
MFNPRILPFTHFINRTRVTRSRKTRVVASAIVFLMASVGTSLLSVTVAQAGGTWGNAVEAAGTAALNAGGNAQIAALSCSSDGNCGAIGFYTVSANDTQAFVMNDVKGTWGSAVEIPGYAALNTGAAVGDVFSIDCPSSGNCSAGGAYTDSASALHAFVVDESGGTWASAEEVPGFASLNTGGLTGSIFSISCTSAGNCSGAGVYGDGLGAAQAFFVDESDGVWGNATEVAGTAGLNAGGLALLSSVSCGSPGNCEAVGSYTDATNVLQDFVVSESGGTWGNAVEIPGLATLNVTGVSSSPNISCSSSGNCSIAGTYGDASKDLQVFVANEVDGAWSSAVEIPGSAALNVGGSASVSGLACSSAGNCNAIGSYTDASNDVQAFTANEVNGVWSSAIEVPGLGVINTGGDAVLLGVSCSANGNCSAGGFYSTGTNTFEAFVVNEVNGSWANAIEVPGTSALDVDNGAAVIAISCSNDGSCVAGGSYSDSSNLGQAFVVDAAANTFAPKAPSIRAASTASGVITISVAGVTATGGAPISGWQYSLNGGAWKKLPGDAHTFHVSHLTPDKKYQVRLRATNSIGSGAASRSASVIVK